MLFIIKKVIQVMRLSLFKIVLSVPYTERFIDRFIVKRGRTDRLIRVWAGWPSCRRVWRLALAERQHDNHRPVNKYVGACMVLSMPTLNRAFAHTIVVEVTGS